MRHFNTKTTSKHEKLKYLLKFQEAMPCLNTDIISDDLHEAYDTFKNILTREIVKTSIEQKKTGGL